MISSPFISTALALSLISVAGCAVDGTDEELELSSEEQALIDDDAEPTDTPPTGTNTIYPLMAVDLVGISVEPRMEDSWVGSVFTGWSHTVEVYGSIAINNVSLARGTVRNLGEWGNPWLKSAINWVSLDGAAPKMYDTQRSPTNYESGPQYRFKDTKLCTSNTYANCQGSFAYNNNVAQVPVRVGDTVRIDFHFQDYDPFDDDEFCKGSVTGVVGKTSTGVYYLKTSATGGALTSATGKATYQLATSMAGPIPFYSTFTDYCKLWFQ